MYSAFNSLARLYYKELVSILVIFSPWNCEVSVEQGQHKVWLVQAEVARTAHNPRQQENDQG